MTFVFELKHFDPSVNQNSRAPVDMKLRTQKDGCLQTMTYSEHYFGRHCNFVWPMKDLILWTGVDLIMFPWFVSLLLVPMGSLFQVVKRKVACPSIAARCNFTPRESEYGPSYLVQGSAGPHLRATRATAPF
jgi:hypothetical protein